MLKLRYPNITGASEKEQLVQMKNYLNQLVDELQWGLSAVNTAESAVVANTQKKAVAAASTSSAIDGAATFAAIKALIIKSADIVEAYYEEINKKLEGAYVAVSDFGTYTENTALDFSATSDRITQAYSNIQTIQTSNAEIGEALEGYRVTTNESLGKLSGDVSQLDSDLKDATDTINGEIEGVKGNVSNLVTKVLETNAYIQQGFLYNENGIPIYGLAIGQKSTLDDTELINKFAAFTPGRLAFYGTGSADWNDPVAYISDYRLYITEADILKSINIGAFSIDATKGFRLKYVGG
jgi:hypothetical protein